jgi:hypothetical protein
VGLPRDSSAAASGVRDGAAGTKKAVK